MSNYKTVFFTLGVLQIILGISMMIPILAQFIYSEIDSSFIGGCVRRRATKAQQSACGRHIPPLVSACAQAHLHRVACAPPTTRCSIYCAQSISSTLALSRSSAPARPFRRVPAERSMSRRSRRSRFSTWICATPSAMAPLTRHVAKAAR